jgi:hypothetical protein
MTACPRPYTGDGTLTRAELTAGLRPGGALHGSPVTTRAVFRRLWGGLTVVRKASSSLSAGGAARGGRAVADADARHDAGADGLAGPEVRKVSGVRLSLVHPLFHTKFD